jgi:hypothetical protein
MVLYIRIYSLCPESFFYSTGNFSNNLLERETSFRRSIRQKSRRAAINDRYMVSVLAAALSNSTRELEFACHILGYFYRIFLNIQHFCICPYIKRWITQSKDYRFLVT